MTELNAEKELSSQNGKHLNDSRTTPNQSDKIQKKSKTFDELLKDDLLEEALEKYQSFLDECDEQWKIVTQHMAELSAWKREDVQGTLHINAANIERNRIRSQILTNALSFRKEVLDDIFDFRSTSKILREIDSRDQFLHEILDIRLEPKRYRRDIEDVERHQRRRGKAWISSKTNDEIERSRQITSKMTESGWYMLHRIKNMDTGRFAVATIIKSSTLSDFMISHVDILSKLRHRNVIKILDSETKLFPFYVISEYVTGRKISNLLDTVGKRSAWQTADWIYQITEAMEYLRNKRIRHVTPIPSNIFVDEEWNIMVSPFDLVLQDKVDANSGNNDYDNKNDYEQSLSQFKEVCQYGSPELLANDGKPLDSVKRMCISDMYSIGLLAFKMLTSKDLFEGSSISKILESRSIFRDDTSKRSAMLEPVKKFENLYNIIIQLLEEDAQKRELAFKGGLHELLRELRRYTTTDLNEGGEALQSYRRCLTYNKNLIKDFYENLFIKHPKIKDDFTNITQERQYLMLQTAIDLLLDLDNRKEQFENLVRPENSKHSKYKIKMFESFIDTLIQTVKHTDADFWNDTVEKAWEEVRTKTITFIQEVRNNKPKSASRAKNQA